MDLVQQSLDVPIQVYGQFVPSSIDGPNSLVLDSCLESKEDELKNKKKVHEIFYYDTMASPLVEIYSVSIHSNQRLKGLEKCEIYGRICVLDKSGYTFDLFNLGEEEAECVDVDDTLLLSFPLLDENEDTLNVIIPSKHVGLDVELFDKAHNDMIIAKGHLDLDRTVADCKGKQICKRVQGDVGFAEVHYAEFPYAVVATVEVLYFSPNDDFDLRIDDVKAPISDDDDDDDDGASSDGFHPQSYDEADKVDYFDHKCESDHADIYGTIIARNDELLSDCSDQQDYRYSSVLFRKPYEESVLVKCGGQIKLLRSIVNVPAFSSLKIEVDLSDRDTRLPIARSTVEFQPEHSEIYKKDIMGDNGRIRVRVKWNDAYRQPFNNERNVKQRRDSATTPATSGVPLAISGRCFHRAPMVEVFSVAVCSKDFQPFSYYGKIRVTTCDADIFIRDENCPLYCPALGTRVELNCHDIYDLADQFSVWVIIKDVNGSVISKGYLSWDRFHITKKWFNRQLCSVIRGERGFAAVHYAIFPHKFSASVNVKLFGNTTTSRVFGELLAYYDIRDFYSSSYQKKYYRSLIFHKNAEEDLPLQSYGSSILLLKSVVMVPKFSSLTFDACLSVCPVHEEGNNSTQGTKLLQGRITFESSPNGERSGKISGGDVHIVISVEFQDW